METRILPEILATETGKKANSILRNCVHCGFCTATCPTYQLLGDELDGPRGRIYLIKGLLEGQPPSREIQRHLDRCLTCRSCETTCPSGVKYSQLVETGRELLAEAGIRPLRQRLLRWAMRHTLAYPARLKPLIGTARLLRPLLPAALRHKIPQRDTDKPLTSGATTASRRVVVFDGCVQSVMAEAINQSARQVLGRLGIAASSDQEQTCCGAVNHHLDDKSTALQFARANLDRWLARLDAGAEAIIFTASACLLEVREYPLLFSEQPDYLEKCDRILPRCKDLAEFLITEDLEPLANTGKKPLVAFHAPCTLQHGLGKEQVIASLLEKLGFSLCYPADAHLCCGSAGTYSILQPEISKQLRERKLQALVADRPDLIVTANIGCLLHMREATETTVTHWVEMLK